MPRLQFFARVILVGLVALHATALRADDLFEQGDLIIEMTDVEREIRLVKADTGEEIVLSSAQLLTGSTVTAFQLEPDGNILMLQSSPSRVVRVDYQTGVQVELATVEQTNDMVLAPNGDLYVANHGIQHVDLDTGIVTYLTAANAFGGQASIEIDPSNGELFALAQTDALYSVDRSTGTLTQRLLAGGRNQLALNLATGELFSSSVYGGDVWRNRFWETPPGAWTYLAQLTATLDRAANCCFPSAQIDPQNGDYVGRYYSIPGGASWIRVDIASGATEEIFAPEHPFVRALEIVEFSAGPIAVLVPAMDAAGRVLLGLGMLAAALTALRARYRVLSPSLRALVTWVVAALITRSQ